MSLYDKEAFAETMDSFFEMMKEECKRRDKRLEEMDKEDMQLDLFKD